jgi:hypothetical protein
VALRRVKRQMSLKFRGNGIKKRISFRSFAALGP